MYVYYIEKYIEMKYTYIYIYMSRVCIRVYIYRIICIAEVQLTTNPLGMHIPNWFKQ